MNQDTVVLIPCFELRPQDRVTIDMEAGDIAWTQLRDKLPVQIKGRVSLETWQATFDTVYGHYDAYLQSFDEPCQDPWHAWLWCGCCKAVCRVLQAKRYFASRWPVIAKSQAVVYRRSGVRVMMARRERSVVAGEHHNVHNDVVGLRFLTMSDNVRGATQKRSASANQLPDDDTMRGGVDVIAITDTRKLVREWASVYT